MTESILTSIKKLLGIVESDISFDAELIMLINSALMVIMQEWYGMDHALRIEDKTATWEDMLGDDVDYEGVKQYIFIRVKLVFDPPTNSAVIEAMRKEMEDLEWRMYVWKDNLRIDSQTQTPAENS